ncbi:MAG: hypothetical protein HYU63_06230, partial [Armatimonadetes bacterium]|nr:hypothetical protein [Armatimonadota bacterium]
GGSFFYTKVVKKPGSSIPLPSLQKTTEGQVGLQAAQKLLDEYPQFVKRAFIQQQIEGTLKTTIGNNWMLEADGKSMTLTNQGTNKIRFTKIPKIATGSSKVNTPSEIKQEEIKTGDLLAILSTGAYNYSMFSHYNRLCAPAVVLIKDKQANLMVKRESYNQLIQNDLIPERLI